MQLTALGRQEGTGGGIHVAIAEKAQHLMGMGGAAFAQVDLDGLEIPAIAETPGQPVHREMIQGPQRSQSLANRLPPAQQLDPVGRIGRELTTEIYLAGLTAEMLLMGGEHLHPPTGMDQPLHAGGGDRLTTLQPFLHQCPLIL